VVWAKNETFLFQSSVILGANGIGEALTTGLIGEAEELNIYFDMLEVIKNNFPAYQLF